MKLAAKDRKERKGKDLRLFLSLAGTHPEGESGFFHKSFSLCSLRSFAAIHLPFAADRLEADLQAFS